MEETGPHAGGGPFARQGLHLLALLALLAPAVWLAGDPRVVHGSLGGAPTARWYALALAVPVLHQVYVAIAWRLQLHGERLTRAFGRAAFPLYAAGFAVLFLARFAALVVLALSNAHVLAEWEGALRILAVLLAIPALWTLDSVVRHFGVLRAFGEDHFHAEVRTRGLVRRGAFRVSGNAMYVFGLLLVWLPGLWWASPAALVVAAFSHAYIWVHYACTELPDLRRLYPSETGRPHPPR